jgi:penicillin-binding protein-related factor A (putative recombinase)
MSRLSEQRVWDTFKRHTDYTDLRLWRMENRCCTGMSDILGINLQGTVFFAEMKSLDEWPARDKTPPLHSAFEPGQIPFLKEWEDWGGNSFVLLRVMDCNEWLLLRPHAIGGVELIDQTRAQLWKYAERNSLESIVEFLEELE